VLTSIKEAFVRKASPEKLHCKMMLSQATRFSLYKNTSPDKQKNNKNKVQPSPYLLIKA
jgi:hypothetical protein